VLLRRVLVALGHRGPDLDLAAERRTALAAEWYGLDHLDPGRRNALVASWWHPGVRFLNPPYGRMCLICKDRVWKGSREAERLGLDFSQRCTTRKHESTTVGDWMELCTLYGSDVTAGPLVAFPAARTSENWFQAVMFGSKRENGRRVFGPGRSGPARAVYVDGRVRFLNPETMEQSAGGSPVGNVFLEWLPPVSERGRWALQTGTIRNDGSGANIPKPVWLEGGSRRASCV